MNRWNAFMGSSTHEIWFLCGCGVEFLKWVQLHFRFQFKTQHRPCFSLATVFTSFYKVRVEGQEVVGILCCLGPLFLASKGQECCRFAVRRQHLFRDWIINIWNDYSPVGNHTFNFSYLVRISVFANFSKMSLCPSLDGNQDSIPRLPYCFFWLFFLCVHIPSLLWLACVWTCSLELREDPGGSRKPISCRPRNGGTKKDFCA